MGLFLISGLAAGLGAWGTMGEGASFHLGTGDRIDRVVALAKGETSAGLAITTQHAALLDCGYALDNLGNELVTRLPEADRTVIPTGCAATAHAISTVNPTQSYAYYIEAAAAARLADWPAFNDRLLLSYLTGPSEQWIATWRVNLAETFYDNLDQTLQVQHADDLRVMASSRAGLGPLVAWYRADPDFRERMTTILETMPALYQRRFISYLRRENG